MEVGIDSLNVHPGLAYIDVQVLAEHRGLDLKRFNNLLMHEKTVSLPYEDSVTFAVNAAKPLVDSLSEEEKDSIEMIITCTESGIDFGKSISTYVHDYLGLHRNCRLFEVKQACYAASAGYQMALNHVVASFSENPKVLVIATDLSRFIVAEGGSALTEDWSFAEPSGGSGAVAFIVGRQPKLLQADLGANGIYAYEVMDTCRPFPDGEAGDSDLSLMSYLDCLDGAYEDYCSKVDEVNFASTFSHLVFHTPFGGMVKGAHRKLMRSHLRLPPNKIEEDFQRRIEPGLSYCQRVGNIMGATIFMALAGVIDSTLLQKASRVGFFSYGSGCCSEFYSGVLLPTARESQQKFAIQQRLDNRYKLSMEEYDEILGRNSTIRFGTQNLESDFGFLSELVESEIPKGQLMLSKISDFHREYQWF